jgi:beta-glucosidase-like glycosyl hydrolase
LRNSISATEERRMNLFKKSCFFLVIALLVLCFSFLRNHPHDSWAQKTLKTMSLDEKIGQLFMIAGYVDPEYAKNEIGNPEIIQEIDRYITHYYVGGIAYVGPSESAKQVALTNHYQEISKYPILIAQDLEWGLFMRLKDGMCFPKNITLGAVADSHLIYKMGREIGNQAKLIGVHMNLSPVLDVNIEPENIVINVRSFGSSPQLVAEKGIAMIRGLQDAGIIASAKHFPGLGDITIDPHLDLPYNKQKKKRLQEVELYPFAQAIKAGVLSIQTEHLIAPALEPDPHTPSSLSSRIVEDLLKKEMGFKGLILSGALRMKALTNYFSEEEIVLKAFLAGSDMLLMPKHFPKAYEALKSALSQGIITEKQVDERVLKILQMKEKVQLNHSRIVSTPTEQQLHSPRAKALKKALYQSALSIVRNPFHLLPLSSHTGPIAYIQLGEAPSTKCLDRLNQSLLLDTFFFSLYRNNLKNGEYDKETPRNFCSERVPFVERQDASQNENCEVKPMPSQTDSSGCFSITQKKSQEEERLFQKIERYSLIILAVYPADSRRIAEIRLLNKDQQKEELKHFRVHGITQPLAELIEALKKYQQKIVVIYFGNPFGISFFDAYETLLMAYEPDSEAQEAAAHVLMSGIGLYPS